MCTKEAMACSSLPMHPESRGLTHGSATQGGSMGFRYHISEAWGEMGSISVAASSPSLFSISLTVKHGIVSVSVRGLLTA